MAKPINIRLRNLLAQTKRNKLAARRGFHLSSGEKQYVINKIISKKK
jgi:energy-coupling factor transporter ATP-binding protein EcfA2